jgi:hypothetical protein
MNISDLENCKIEKFRWIDAVTGEVISEYTFDNKEFKDIIKPFSFENTLSFKNN